MVLSKQKQLQRSRLSFVSAVCFIGVSFLSLTFNQLAIRKLNVHINSDGEISFTSACALASAVVSFSEFSLIDKARRNPGEPIRMTNLKSNATTAWTFGYFDKHQLSPDLSRALIMKLPYLNKPIGSLHECAEVGVINTHTRKYTKIVDTCAWNFQQGSMLQWLGESNELIIFNQREIGEFDVKAVVYNVTNGKRERQYNFPVYDVSRDGKVAVILNFIRLAWKRKDYGYYYPKEHIEKEQANPLPSNDGVRIADLNTGSSELVLSIEDLARHVIPGGDLARDVDPLTGKPPLQYFEWEKQKHCEHWINHAQLNEDGGWLTFLLRFTCSQKDDGDPMHTQQFSIRSNGLDLWRIPGISGSHHDIVGTKVMACNSAGLVFADIEKKTGIMEQPPDHGHCSFHPVQHDIVLSDTYPKFGGCKPHGCKHLFLRHLHEGKGNTTSRIVTLGKYPPMNEQESRWGPMRIDLHPRWSYDGTYITFDSGHEGVTRNSYVMYVGHLIKQQRKVFLDFGAFNGDTLQKFLTLWHPGDGNDYELFAFEANPQNWPAVEATSKKLRERNLDVTMVKAAVSDEDKVIYFHTDTRDRKTGGSIMDSPYAQGDLTPVVGISAADWIVNNVAREDHVVMKIDVEGAEFMVLADMVRKGALGLIDEIYVEWHERFVSDHKLTPAAYVEIFKQLNINYTAIA